MSHTNKFVCKCYLSPDSFEPAVTGLYNKASRLLQFFDEAPAKQGVSIFELPPLNSLGKVQAFLARTNQQSFGSLLNLESSTQSSTIDQLD